MAYPVTVNGKTYDLDFTFSIGARNYADPVAGLRPFLLDLYSDLVLRGVTYSSSTSSLTIGTGAKSVTLADASVFVPGQYVVIASTANSGNFVEGRVTAYNAGTKLLTINSEFTGGSGTFASWNVSVSGARGPVGATGGISGPASSTVNSLARWSNTTGTATKNSGVTVDDSNNLVAPGSITGGSIITSGNGNITAGGTGTLGASLANITDVAAMKVARLPLVTTGGLPTGGAAATTPAGNVHLFADANGLGLLYNGGVVRRFQAGSNVTLDSNGISVASASTTQAGVVRLATTAETRDWTNNTVALTPASVRLLTNRRALTTQPIIGNLGDQGGICVTTDGRVLYSGSNTNRVMGVGDLDTHVQVFTPHASLPRTLGAPRLWLDYNAFYALYPNGDVYAVGINTSGKIQVSGNAVVATKIPFSEPITDLVAGFANGGYWGDRGGLVAKGASGAYYALGGNSEGQLLGNGTTTSPLALTQVPYAYEKVWGIPGNGGIMFGRDANKVLWVWGYSYAGRAGNGSDASSPSLTSRVTVLNVPQTSGEYVDEIEVKVADNAATGVQFDSQVLFRTNLGNLYVTGLNDVSQAGIATSGAGRTATWIYQPQLLASGVAKGHVINSRYGGAYLKTDGTLWMYGQLMGNGAINVSQVIAPVGGTKAVYNGDSAFFDGKVAKMLSNRTSYDTPWFAVLTTDGRVYATGYNGNGNLGLGNTTWASTFTLVPASAEGGITDIFCQNNAGLGSLTMVNQDGELLTVGSNSQYNTGVPKIDGTAHYIHMIATLT